MAESTQITYTHREVAEMLVKHQGLREGIWGLFLKFGIQAANIGPDAGQLVPAAIIPVLAIGLQKFDSENALAVDAAKVNPAPPDGP